MPLTIPEGRDVARTVAREGAVRMKVAEVAGVRAGEDAAIKAQPAAFTVEGRDNFDGSRGRALAGLLSGLEPAKGVPHNDLRPGEHNDAARWMRNNDIGTAGAEAFVMSVPLPLTDLEGSSTGIMRGAWEMMKAGLATLVSPLANAVNTFAVGNTLFMGLGPVSEPPMRAAQTGYAQRMIFEHLFETAASRAPDGFYWLEEILDRAYSFVYSSKAGGGARKLPPHAKPVTKGDLPALMSWGDYLIAGYRTAKAKGLGEAAQQALTKFASTVEGTARRLGGADAFPDLDKTGPEKPPAGTDAKIFLEARKVIYSKVLEGSLAGPSPDISRAVQFLIDAVVSSRAVEFGIGSRSEAWADVEFILATALKLTDMSAWQVQHEELKIMTATARELKSLSVRPPAPQAKPAVEPSARSAKPADTQAIKDAKDTEGLVRAVYDAMKELPRFLQWVTTFKMAGALSPEQIASSLPELADARDINALAAKSAGKMSGMKGWRELKRYYGGLADEAGNIFKELRLQHILNLAGGFDANGKFTPNRAGFGAAVNVAVSASDLATIVTTLLDRVMPLIGTPEKYARLVDIRTLYWAAAERARELKNWKAAGRYEADMREYADWSGGSFSKRVEYAERNVLEIVSVASSEQELLPMVERLRMPRLYVMQMVRSGDIIPTNITEEQRFDLWYLQSLLGSAAVRAQALGEFELEAEYLKDNRELKDLLKDKGFTELAMP